MTALPEPGTDTPGPEVTIFPSTDAQRRLWFLDRLEGGSSSYLLAWASWLDGHLDEEAFGASVADLIDRHEALRTALVEIDGEPVQVVEDQVPHPLFVEPLDHLPSVEAERFALTAARNAATEPMALDRAPPLRVCLWRIRPDRRLLLIVLHHAFADGWSLQLIGRELAQAYVSHHQGGATLARPPLQFGDWAAWLEANPDGGCQPAMLAWWLRQLSDVPSLGLSFDRPRRPAQVPSAGRVSAEIPAPVARAVEAAARQRGATPFVAWAALWAATLGEAAEQTDVALGTFVAGRERPELETVVGPFANTVVLRLDLSGEPTVAVVIDRMRSTVLDAFAHQPAPFAHIVGSLPVARDDGRSPLFQAAFVLEERPAEPLKLPGIAPRIVDLPPATPKFETTLELLRDTDNLTAHLEYDATRFVPSTARRLIDRFISLAAAAADNLEHRLRPFPATSELKSAGTASRSSLSDLERRVAEICQQLLGRGHVASEDNFFDLGGHSLLAARLVARIRTQIGVSLPVRAVFENPRLGSLAEAVQVAVDRAAVPAEGIEALDIPRVARREALPLSPTQARLWFLARLEPESPAYIIAGAYRLEGRLDTEILRRAIAEVQRRHETLRTRFENLDGRPVQIVEPESGIPLPVTDLEPLPADLREAELVRLAREEAQRPFRLDRAPLVRGRLIRLEPDHNILVVALHHIIADGWSVTLLLREVAVSYSAIVEGRRPDLAPLPIQYADWTAWAEARLEDERERKHAAFWRNTLAGTMPLDLPTDRPRPPVLDHRGDTQPIAIDLPIADRLGNLARSVGATRFMGLLTLWAALLMRYTGQDDIVIGVPVADRLHPAAEALIGCFVNTMPVRIDLSGGIGFREALCRVRDATLAAYSHAELPFDRLLAVVEAPRSLSRTPLFDVMFAFESDDGTALPANASLAITPCAFDAGVVQYDLALHLKDGPEGPAGHILWRSALFDSGTISRMAEHLERLLGGALAHPDLPITRLPLLTSEELRRLNHWTDTRVDYPGPHTLDAIVAQQCAVTPAAPAITDGKRCLSYAAFGGEVSSLAAKLRRRNVGRGTIVGVCIERSTDLVVALHAITAAGATFLPLDPHAPRPRTQAMIEDAAPALILVAATRPDSLPSTIPTLDVRQEGAASARSLTPVVDPDDLAYVLFTSGSTGRPKGAMISHRAITNRLFWMQQFYPIGPGDRVLQKTPATFDVSIWEFFWPLATGATLVVAPPSLHRSLRDLAQLIAAERISVLHFVPSMLAAFLTEAEPAALQSVKRVFVSGEALTAELERRFFALGLPARLHNLYGPTEAAIDVTAWDCLPFAPRRQPPIGFAVPNTQIHVLDREGQPTPIGVPGEIHIGGVQVGLGYIGRPDLTAERFILDPFAKDLTSRMYRTGDRGRYLVDGSIEYLGRLDDQVKLRGQRIELGEIEAVLASHPVVRRAAAAVTDATSPRARITAYVETIDGTSAPAPGTLRTWLAERLPEIMVPATIIPVAELPFNASGKLDRRRLTHLDPLPAAEEPAEPPDAGRESEIAAIWADVLGHDRFGATDTFFEAGGNSLLLVQVEARLQRVFPSLRLVDLFQHPSVRALARFLGSAPEEAAPAPYAPAVVGPATRIAEESIAIVGMAARVPGAADVDELWRLLVDEREAIINVSAADMIAQGVDPALLAEPTYVPRAAAPDGVDLFDADFFGLSPAEAAELDPQIRLFLEVVWQALERAGWDPARPPGPIGVFAGASLSTYALAQLLAEPDLAERDPVAAYQRLIASDKDYLATRTAYALGLTGPAIGVQTACSTSLVAVHLAAEALRRGECALAVAGGATISVPTRVGYRWQEGGIASRVGRCRAFDAAADGTVAASGVAAVVLAPLALAIDAGDPILAVLRGSAINNDGSGKLAFTAPAINGQVAVITAAQKRAGVDSEAIGYVEAHGTATALGDVVEVSALSRAFARPGAVRSARCLIGSVKTNLGHLDAAAGVTGLIKAAKAVETGIVPASLHFKEPNPRLDLDRTPFRVASRTQEWPSCDGPRLAGVSSFGIGGTNAHAIIEEPPTRPAGPDGRRWQVLPLSARGPQELARQAASLAQHVASPDVDLRAVAYTLQTGRSEFAKRAIVVADSVGSAIAQLERIAQSEDEAALIGNAPLAAPEIVFMLSGQGTQFPGMAAGLDARTTPVFAATVDRCLSNLDEALAHHLQALLFERYQGAEAVEALARTDLAQPALFLLEYGLARQLIAWGLQPAGLIGHSLGEWAAAALAEVFDEATAVRLVAERGRLMQAAPAGAMLGVSLGEAAIGPFLSSDITLAAVNAPDLTVLAGPESAIAALRRRLESEGTPCRQLAVRHAFHTEAMRPAAEGVARAVADVRRRPPAIPIVSNIHGRFLSDGEAMDPAYWAQHVLAPVRFADGLRTLLAEPGRQAIEVGPGRTLVTLARAAPTPARSPIATLPGATEASEIERAVVMAVARLWLSGVTPNWRAFHCPAAPLKAILPTHPFNRQRHWINPQPLANLLGPSSMTREAGGLHRAIWIRHDDMPTAGAPTIARRCVVTLDHSSCGSELASILGAFGPLDVIGSDRVESQVRDAPGTQSIWLAIGATSDLALAVDRFTTAETVVAALVSAGFTGRLIVVSAGAADVLGDEPLDPAGAMAAALPLVASQEAPPMTGVWLDLDPTEPLDQARLEQVVATAEDDRVERRLARRGGRWWYQSWPVLEPVKTATAELPRAPHVVITGGLGRIGRAIAQHWAARYGACLTLIGRTPRGQWESLIEEIRSAGGAALTLTADVTDSLALTQTIDRARAHFGPIDVVLHAAGVGTAAAYRPLGQTTDPIASAALIRAKTVGLVNLFKALASDEPRTIGIAFSSLATVLGGLGFAAYAGGNLGLETLGAHGAREHDRPWLTVAWDGWDLTPPGENAPHPRPPLTTPRALEILDRLIAEGRRGRVVVAGEALLPRLRRWVIDPSGTAGPEQGVSDTKRTHRSARTTQRALVPPRTGLETEIARLWADLLGLAEIGVEDDFFELGGHSLLAVRMLGPLKAIAGIPVELAALLEATTVARLAELIEELRWAARVRRRAGPVEVTEFTDSEIEEDAL